MTKRSVPKLVFASTLAIALPFVAAAQTDSTVGGDSAASTEVPTSEDNTVDPSPADTSTNDTSTAEAATADAGASQATAAPEMQAVLDKMKELGAKPLHTLSVEEARSQPTPADAVKAIMTEKGIDPGQAADISARDITIPGPAGDIMARVYTPAGAGPFPVIVYYHGGGWVIADIDTYDASARALALGVEAIVVSSHYRQGPENVFPAAHDDAYAAYVWTVENSGALNGDASRMALVGESAGGNLAANVAIMARDAKITMPLHQVLVYPIAGNDMTTPSYEENAEAAPLGKADMAWFVEHAFASKEDAADPRIDLVGRDDLSDLPPATVIAAQIDPLRSESVAYGEALKAAGNEVEIRVFEGVSHEFFGMVGVVPQAKEAMTLATGKLKAALAK